MGCLTLSSAGNAYFSPQSSVDRELLDSIRVELRSQLEIQSLKFPHRDGSDAADSLGSLVRMYLVSLPKLEAILALNTPLVRQSFDARTSISELCPTHPVKYSSLCWIRSRTTCEYTEPRVAELLK